MNAITSQLRAAAACTALAALLGSGAVHADDAVIVLDRADVQKLRSVDEGFRASELVGTDVHGSAGGYIGEVEDFVVARGGYLYAVIDTTQGPLEELASLGDDETIVVPWNELRTQAIE
ncbi:MAG: PRC-barrel domain-containing protein [Gammaproteobacteria bacterium]